MDDIGREHLAMPGDQLKFVANFAESHLADIEPYIDEESMGGGIVLEERWGKNLRTATNLTVNCNSTKFLNSDLPSYVSIHVSDRTLDSSLSINDNETLDYTATVGGDHDLYEKEGVPVEEAFQDPDFIKQINFMIEGIESVQVPKKEYLRHDVPNTLTTTPLTVEEQHAASTELNSTTALFRPEYRITADTGESWFASNLQTDGSRSYALLYAHDATPYAVYTSMSQGTWRLLPRVGRPDNPSWHDKGPFGEEALNLPIVFQKSLQDMQQANHEEHIPINQDILVEELKDITATTYDAFLSGAEAKQVWLDERDPESTLLPKTIEHATPYYSFTSPLYGAVEASTVSSRDGSVEYLVFTRAKTGDRWIGTAQPKDAKMLESFIPDGFVRSFGMYAPPIEYNRQDGEKGYEDNADRAAQSVAVRALNS